MTVFGPDVSKWQAGLIPPEPPGIGFGICRAANGMSPDSTVTRILDWLKARNVPFCAYHFVYPIKSHPAVAQAEAFHNIVGSSKINCMLDWEEDKDDNCHPGAGPQVPKWDDVLAVAAEIRKLGHKVPLLYANYYYWKDTCGSPTLTGQGFDLVNAKYGNNNAIATPQASYAAQGGDSGPGWNGYGGLTPVLWQFGSQITWGNKNLDMNAYRGDPKVLNKWFTIWEEKVVTYPYAWGSTKLTMEELEGKQTIKNAHPEFWRRVKPMLEAGNGRLGVGTIWRSSEVQRTTFLSRHYVVSSGGCCSYNGSRYQLKKGMAHAAPPGKSFHESTFHGYAQAMDAVGDLSWMHSVEKAYGLKDFRNVGNEPWHIQLAEIPNSVTQWKAAGSPQPIKWNLPGTSSPPPVTTPPPVVVIPVDPVKGTASMGAPLVLRYGGTPTANWSGYFSFDGITRQSVRGMHHASQLVALGAIDAKKGTKVSNSNWSDVTHTSNAEELDEWLTPGKD